MARSRALLAGAALSLAGFLSLAVFAAQDHFFDLDRLVRDLVQLVRHDGLQTAMTAVSVLGDDAGLIPLIAVTSALLWRPHWRWALGLPGLMAGAGGLQVLAKWAIDRPRPNEAPWGFPSGHVLVLVVFFGVIAYLVWRSSPGRARRFLAGGSCAGLVLAVAVSRLYLEAHWLSDVVGGFLVGLAYLLVGIWVIDGRSWGVEARRSTVPAVGLETAPPDADVTEGVA